MEKVLTSDISWGQNKIKELLMVTRVALVARHVHAGRLHGGSAYISTLKHVGGGVGEVDTPTTGRKTGT